MAHFDQTSAECLVFTFKEGLLSAIAHDLMIRVTRFSVEVTPSPLAVDARFEAASLQVVMSVRDGAPDKRTLSDEDKRKIEQSILEDVLHASTYPEIRFVSSSVTAEGDGFRVAGELTLHGKSRPLTLRSCPDGARQVAEVTLHQPDYGIKPFTAMLGALKVKPDVTVRVSVPRVP